MQEKLRGQLQGLGLSGEGDPCDWPGIECYYCYVCEIHSTEATGEITELTKLDLKGSQVTGDIAELLKLKNLQYLNLAQTQVMGNVEKLSQRHFRSFSFLRRGLWVMSRS